MQSCERKGGSRTDLFHKLVVMIGSFPGHDQNRRVQLVVRGDHVQRVLQATGFVVGRTGEKKGK